MIDAVELEATKAAAIKSELPKPVKLISAVKKRPKFLIEAVALLTSDTSEGKIGLGLLGQYLKRTDPGFSPTIYGHSGLLDMVKTYELLALKKVEGADWTVGLAPKNELSESLDKNGI
jgi:hypothetical protein